MLRNLSVKLAYATVLRYVPGGKYGFVDSSGTHVYFHVGIFDAGGWPEPPPIIGEGVELELDEGQHIDGMAPKARRVLRVAKPVSLTGVVKSFQRDSGWGFIDGNGSEPYYLHRSEVRDGRLPIIGQHASFFAGYCKGRPRACYVELLN
jgi:cold shock CspA family protein